MHAMDHCSAKEFNNTPKYNLNFGCLDRRVLAFATSAGSLMVHSCCTVVGISLFWTAVWLSTGAFQYQLASYVRHACTALTGAMAHEDMQATQWTTLQSTGVFKHVKRRLKNYHYSYL